MQVPDDARFAKKEDTRAVDSRAIEGKTRQRDGKPAEGGGDCQDGLQREVWNLGETRPSSRANVVLVNSSSGPNQRKGQKRGEAGELREGQGLHQTSKTGTEDMPKGRNRRRQMLFPRGG